MKKTVLKLQTLMAVLCVAFTLSSCSKKDEIVSQNHIFEPEMQSPHKTNAYVNNIKIELSPISWTDDWVRYQFVNAN